MKKKLVLVALVLALALSATFALAACGDSSKDSGSGDSNSSSSESAASGVVGEWKLDSAEAGGQKLEGAQFEALQYLFTFKEDGTANVNVMGQSLDNVKYTFADNKVTFEDASLAATTLTLEGDQLVAEDASGVKLLFKKQ